MRAASNLHAQQGKRHDTDIPAVIPAGPAVRRIARQRNIDLSLIEGSGARGRITIGDVESAAGKRLATLSPARSGTPYRHY